MTRGSSLTDEELEALGVSRETDPHGKALYHLKCDICGRPMTTRQYSTTRVYKCRLCKSDVVKKRNEKVRAAREEVERVLAEDMGIDQKHLRRFEKAAACFGEGYERNVSTARRAIGKYDSIPEAVACIELLHIGARVIVHQRVGDFTVDFCLPDEKVVLEVDGSLYHRDESKTYRRDYAVTHMLGDGWIVKHVPADAVAKDHAAFGKGMRRMLNARREELGLERLKTRK